MTRDVKVSELMTTALVTVRPDQSISAASAEMQSAGVRHLPVVDEQQHLVGILSNRDLLFREATLSVADVMTRDVRTIPANAPARRAAAMLLEHKISSLPAIGDDGQIVGLVTETDFLRLAYEHLSGCAQ